MQQLLPREDREELARLARSRGGRLLAEWLDARARYYGGQVVDELKAGNPIAAAAAAGAQQALLETRHHLLRLAMTGAGEEEEVNGDGREER